MCLTNFRRNSLLAALLLASLCLPLISSYAQDQAPVQRSPRGWLDANVKEEYKNWLREDVVYIITDQERADFKNLMTDQQRDEFVIAFWERRNPTPGAPENKFKEEHYRRLAYANQHFASGMPGWRTDRGRIYIMFGPPDKLTHLLRSDIAQRDDLDSEHWHWVCSDDFGRPVPNSLPDSIPKHVFDAEQWQWEYTEGMGRDIILTFADTCSCGEYHMLILMKKDRCRSEPGPAIEK
jgi:GWxTD domain-containing protein